MKVSERVLVQWGLRSFCGIMGLEYISSSWMMKELLLSTDLSFPQTWIQSSPLGCRQFIQHHQVTPATIQEVTDAPSRSKLIFKKKKKGKSSLNSNISLAAVYGWCMLSSQGTN